MATRNLLKLYTIGALVMVLKDYEIRYASGTHGEVKRGDILLVCGHGDITSREKFITKMGVEVGDVPWFEKHGGVISVEFITMIPDNNATLRRWMQEETRFGYPKEPKPLRKRKRVI